MEENTVIAFRSPANFQEDPLTEVLQAGAHKLLAQAYQSQGRLSEALAEVKTGSSLAPSNQDFWLMGAEIQSAMGHHGDARAWLQEGHRLMPDQGLIAHALGRLLATSPELQVRDGARAVELATRVANATGDLGHWHTVAEALAEAGRCEDAAGVMRQILEKVGAESRGPLEARLKAFDKGAPCRP